MEDCLEEETGLLECGGEDEDGPAETDEPAVADAPDDTDTDELQGFALDLEEVGHFPQAPVHPGA